MKKFALLVALVFATAASAYADDSQPPPTPDALKSALQAAFPSACHDALNTGATGYHEPDSFKVSYHDSRDDAAAPDHQMMLYQLFCSFGAINFGRSVFFRWDSSAGLQPVSFSTPSLVIKYAKDKQGKDDLTKVVSQKVDGMLSNVVMINAEYQFSTKTVVAHVFWRDLGDASTIAVWALQDGNFVLKTFDVDAAFDKKVTLKRLFDYQQPK